jgi:hypothetical protein
MGFRIRDAVRAVWIVWRASRDPRDRVNIELDGGGPAVPHPRQSIMDTRDADFAERIISAVNFAHRGNWAITQADGTPWPSVPATKARIAECYHVLYHDYPNPAELTRILRLLVDRGRLRQRTPDGYEPTARP